MRLGMAGLLVGAALLVASPAAATTWDLSSATGNLGPSEAYVSAGLTITAYGYTMANGATDLYGKQEGSDESGLGIATDPYGEHEISSADYINLDVHDVVSAGITSGFLLLGSIQPGEGYTICFGNSIGALGTNCFSGDLTRPIRVEWGQNSVVGITGTGRDVLLSSVVALRNRDLELPTPAPEPATLVLLGSGLASLGLGARKRRAASKEIPPPCS